VKALSEFPARVYQLIEHIVESQTEARAVTIHCSAPDHNMSNVRDFLCFGYYRIDQENKILLIHLLLNSFCKSRLCATSISTLASY